MKRIDPTDPRTIRYRFRRKRFKVVEAMIRQVLSVRGEARVLDVGGRANYWAMLDRNLRDRVVITIVNYQSELESHRGKEDDLRLVCKHGDGCNLENYDECSFDISHSNSVIEHVGSYSNMIRFSKETQRVGRGYYMQTPNFWFPLDPHYGVPFVHWLPDALRISLHSSFNLGYARKTSYQEALSRVDHCRMVDKRLIRELFSDGHVFSERYMFMAKSIIAIRWPEGRPPCSGRVPDRNGASSQRQ